MIAKSFFTIVEREDIKIYFASVYTIPEAMCI